MATITNSTGTTLDAPGRAMIDRMSDGTLFAAVRRSNGNLGFWYSKNNGTSWTDSGGGNDIPAGTAAQEYSNLWIDQGNFATVAWREYDDTNDLDVIKIRYGGPNGTTTGWVWNPTRTLFSGAALTAGARFQGIDLAVIGDPTGRYPAMLVLIAAGGTGVPGNLLFRTYAVDYHGNFLARQQLAINATADTVCRPSLDFRHTGNGKTSISTPEFLTVHDCGDAGGAKYSVYRWRWGGSAFTGGGLFVYGSGYSQPAAPPQARRMLRVDGQGRLLIPQVTGTDVPIVVEYDVSRTTRTNRTPPPHPTGVVTNVAVSYDPAGNIYLFAVGTSTNVLYRVQWVRSTNTWGTWTSVNATALASPPAFTVRRGGQNNRIDSMTETGTSTRTYTNQQQAVSGTPTAPPWKSVGGIAHAVNNSLLLEWTFRDPDPADTQSAYALARRVGVAAFQYWRASDSTWQAAEVKNTSTAQAVTVPSGWGADSDAIHQYWAKTWDSTDSPSPYGPALQVIPSVRVEPTITAPTEGQVIGGPETTITWTVAQQSAWRIEIRIAGDLIAAYEQPDPDARSATVGGLLNGTAYQIWVITANNEGLWALGALKNVTVTYTPPPTPTVDFVTFPYPHEYAIGVEVTNPAGSPAAVRFGVDRRETGDDGTRVTIAENQEPNTTVVDYRVRSGVEYEYLVVAAAASGAESETGWIG